MLALGFGPILDSGQGEYVGCTGGEWRVEVVLEKASVLSVGLVPICHRRRGQNGGQPFLQRRNSKCRDHSSDSQNVYLDVKTVRAGIGGGWPCDPPR